jgi:hypothetical protein
MTPSCFQNVYHEAFYQFWKQVEVRGVKSGEYGGWERISQTVAAAIATWDV